MNWRAHGFFAAHAMIGSRVKYYYDEFLRLHNGPAHLVGEIQQQRLEELLVHAKLNVPFYRDRVSKQKPLLEDFPIVTKKNLVNQFDDFMAPHLAREYHTGARGYGWIEVKTGGTTGVPVTVIHDKDFRDRGRASRLFSQYLCGFPLGVPYYWLWGAMEEIDKSRSSLSKRALHFFLNTYPMNAFRMTQDRIESYIDKINETRIEHMMAYIDAAVELVRVARKLGKPLRQLESVMACAGTLTDDARAQIVPFLAKRVHNKYGSRECTDMACESADGRFNIFSHHTLLEVVDENGRPVPEGATGKILVTLLGNHSFPIIRYKIGDMGAIKKTRNRDENTWPEFDKLEGRTTDFISDTRGDYISPVFVRHLIGVMHNPGVIERYQLRQNQAKKYTLLLQVEAGIGEEMYRKIVSGLERDFKEVLGQDAELEFQRVTAIEESASGKFQYIRNLYKTT